VSRPGATAASPKLLQDPNRENALSAWRFARRIFALIYSHTLENCLRGLLAAATRATPTAPAADLQLPRQRP